MKILFYNLGYGRGHVGSIKDYLLKINRFFFLSKQVQRSILNDVALLVTKEKPDIFTYAEISSGSFWNNHMNQHEYLLGKLGVTVVVEAVLSKYGETMINTLPMHNGNANGVISFRQADISEHYLAHSRKRLVFRTELNDITIFTVHLPLVSTDRKKQLHELSCLLKAATGDVVVCGDFNIFNGLDELSLLQEEAGLKVAGCGEFTFPSYKPKIQLDVFLYRFQDESIVPTLRVLPLTTSDHLPIVLEW
ncbi:hypothetical protein CL653_02165 [bacterium]|nr:hypothetical protein [bacterium]